jgi:uncharacterized protein (DUF488 family)
MDTVLYSFGYQGRAVDEISRLIQTTGGVLVDVRMVPSSRIATWRQGPLIRRFGGSYLHVGALGNRNYRGGPIELVDALAGMRIVMELLERRPVVLMCGCRDAATCHRTVIAQQIAAAMPGLRVEQV